MTLYATETILRRPFPEVRVTKVTEVKSEGYA